MPWRSKDHQQELIFFFSHLDPQDPTPVARLGCNCLLLAEPTLCELPPPRPTRHSPQRLSEQERHKVTNIWHQEDDNLELLRMERKGNWQTSHGMGTPRASALLGI